MKGFEVVGIRQPDGGTVVAVAPNDVDATVDPHQAWVVAIAERTDLGIGALKTDRSFVDPPREAVVAVPSVELHASSTVVDAEHAGESPVERDHRAVVNIGRRPNRSGWHDRILRVAPERIAVAQRTLLPGDVG